MASSYQPKRSITHHKITKIKSCLSMDVFVGGFVSPIKAVVLSSIHNLVR